MLALRGVEERLEVRRMFRGVLRVLGVILKDGLGAFGILVEFVRGVLGVLGAL